MSKMELQKELQALINSILNGGFSNIGYLTYPLIKNLSKENQRKANKIANLVNHPVTSEVNVEMAAEIIELGYLKFSKMHGATTNAKKEVLQLLKLKDYSKTMYFQQISMIKKFAEENITYFRAFYIHGSLATMDYVGGWSDLDSYIVLKKEAVNKSILLLLQRRMIKARKLLLEIDPLQHHGFIVTTEFDLEYYNETFMPIEVLKNAKAVIPDTLTLFKIRESKQETRLIILNKLSFLETLSKKKRLDPYHSKLAVALILLLPTLYLQTKNVLVYKRDSFGLASKMFTKDAWKVVEEAEHIRSTWKSVKVLPLVKLLALINPIAAYYINNKIVGCFSRPALPKKWLYKSKLLIDEMRK